MNPVAFRGDGETKGASIDTLLAGDLDTGKAILRDYVRATVGFEKLGEVTGSPTKSLIRMFEPRRNPQARNLFGILGARRNMPACSFMSCQTRYEAIWFPWNFRSRSYPLIQTELRGFLMPRHRF